MKNYKNAFTLVELIVVITILAILGSIAFVSLQGYSKNARDGQRISDISSIEKGLELMLSKQGIINMPDNKVDIFASGALINYQGNAGDEVLIKVGINKGGGKDPLDGKYYTYVTNKDLNKYQLFGFLENGNNISFNNKLTSIANAEQSRDNKIYYSRGSRLGVVIDPNILEPIQNTGTGIDIAKTNLNYIVYIDNSSNGTINGTGGVIINSIAKDLAGIYNKSCSEILSNNIYLYGINGIYTINPTGITNAGFQVYCDMSTDGGGWTILVNNDNKDKENLSNTDCTPRLTSYSNYKCGDPTDLNNDFSLNSKGIKFKNLVWAAYSGSFNNITTYQYMKWLSYQIIPNEVQVFQLPNASSGNNIIPSLSLINILKCNGITHLTISTATGSGHVNIEPHTSIGGSTYSTSQISFTDGTTNDSTTSSTYGLDDYQDGHGCGDSWQNQISRGYSSYIMVR